MFAHVMAVLLGLGSVMFYVAAFFYPEVHRRSDVFLSGAGMLYAVLLWFCAGQMTAMVALSQVMAIALLLFLGWQTLSIRREKTPVYQQTPVSLTPEVVGDWAKNTINQLRIAPADKMRPLRPQNPSLNGTSADRFRQPIDPRRRPVYDYEFVEDGIAADAPAEAAFEDVTALVEAVPDVIPPSAEAEVLVAEVSESEKRQVERAIADDALTSDFDAEGLESEAETTAQVKTNLELEDSDATEEVVSEEETVFETDNASEIDISVESDSMEGESIEDALTEDKSTANGSTGASDNWDFLEEDDDFDSGKAIGSDAINAPQSESFRQSGDDQSSASNSPQRPAQTPIEKPAIWKMPIILAGWMKDVVTSMTKPKASKPMIEIPRREPSQSVASNAVKPVTNEPSGNPVDNTAARAPSPSPDVSLNDAQADNFMADSNDDIFDDFNQANWVERAEDMPKVVVNNRADETANETIEESNWDD